MATIEERANLAAWQIYEEIGLSKHSVDRVAEIIEEKIREQKDIDIENACKACEWLEKSLPDIEYITNASAYRQSKSEFIDTFRKAMEEEL